MVSTTYLSVLSTSHKPCNTERNNYIPVPHGYIRQQDVYGHGIKIQHLISIVLRGWRRGTALAVVGAIYVLHSYCCHLCTFLGTTGLQC
ncbi:hypothetical protein J6590_008698 [Homalodisca vitripennis]|nr:hypothetical protein J6590_008698 [Homalodisca vitripennis]